MTTTTIRRKRYTCANCGFSTNSMRVIDNHMHVMHPAGVLPEVKLCHTCYRPYVTYETCPYCAEKKS